MKSINNLSEFEEMHLSRRTYDCWFWFAPDLQQSKLKEFHEQITKVAYNGWKKMKNSQILRASWRSILNLITKVAYNFWKTMKNRYYK